VNKKQLYTIGEMSLNCSLTVKTLRFYDDNGLLPAAFHDAQTGYRYYGRQQVKTARKIRLMKNLGFQLEEIRPCLNPDFTGDQLQILLKHKKEQISKEIREKQRLKQELSVMEQFLREENTMNELNGTQIIEEKQIQPMLVASLRYKGKYQNVGDYIGRLYKKYGRISCGTIFCRYHDGEYRENDADIEVCLPVKKSQKADGFKVYELETGRFVCLNHNGPYEKLGETYQALADYCKSYSLLTAPPSREIYHKGPGMFFRGNPEKYITEIQLKIKQD